MWNFFLLCFLLSCLFFLSFFGYFFVKLFWLVGFCIFWLIIVLNWWKLMLVNFIVGLFFYLIWWLLWLFEKCEKFFNLIFFWICNVCLIEVSCVFYFKGILWRSCRKGWFVLYWKRIMFFVGYYLWYWVFLRLSVEGVVLFYLILFCYIWSE